MKNLKIFLSAAAFAAACQSGAQMLTSGPTPINILAPQWKMGVSADAAGEFSLPADMSEDLGGDLGVYSAAANVKFQGAYSDRHFLTVSLNYTYSRYDFSSGAAPFSSMDKTSALAFYTTRIDERWGVFGIAGASFGAQAGESLWGGRSMFAGAGASYSFCENLTAGIGAIAYSRVDNTWIGLPVAFIDWNISDRIKLRTFSGAALLYDLFGDNSLGTERGFRVQELVLQAGRARRSPPERFRLVLPVFSRGDLQYFRARVRLGGGRRKLWQGARHAPQFAFGGRVRGRRRAVLFRARGILLLGVRRRETFRTARRGRPRRFPATCAQ